MKNILIHAAGDEGLRQGFGFVNPGAQRIHQRCEIDRDDGAECPTARGDHVIEFRPVEIDQRMPLRFEASGGFHDCGTTVVGGRMP